MNAAVSHTERLFSNAVPVLPPPLLCDCGEVSSVSDMVLYQNNYWNSSVREWVKGDCATECCECSKRFLLAAGSPMLLYRRSFLRVEQVYGR